MCSTCSAKFILERSTLQGVYVSTCVSGLGKLSDKLML